MGTVSPSCALPSLHNVLISLNTASSHFTTKMSPQELDVSLEIWNKAYDRLKREQPKMVEVYEKILSSHLAQCKTFLYFNEQVPCSLRNCLHLSKATVAQITMDVTNRFVNCNPQVRLKRMEDVTHRSLDKAQKYEKAETEVVSAAENIIGIAGFLSSLVAAFPPVAMAITGISAVLPVRFSPCLSSRILRDPN